MALAQGTGIDRVVLGKRGFGEIGRALSGKRNGLRNPEDIEFLNDAAPYPSLGHVEFTPDGIERYVRDGYVYQAFTATPVFEDGFRMGTPETTVEQFALENPRRFNPTGRNPVKSRRRNPQTESDAVYESFHGVPPSETLEVHETLHVHGHLAGLGDLCHLVVKLSAGTKAGKEIQLNAPDPAKAPDADIVRLTANEDKSTVYFVGGDQSLDLRALGFRESFDITHDGEKFEATDFKDNMIIGLVCRIMYRTEKKFDDFEMIDYHHLHGEDTSKYPTLTYDNLNQKMGMFGGEYAVAPEGIVN